MADTAVRRVFHDHERKVSYSGNSQFVPGNHARQFTIEVTVSL